MNLFDRVVILSLDKRIKDRTIDLELKKWGIDSEIFLCGEGSLFPSYLYDWIDEQAVGRCQAWNYTKCLKKILWQSWKNGHENILFLEDDATINPRYKHNFYDCLSFHFSNLNGHTKEWDMFYLGGNLQSGTMEKLCDGIVSSNYILDMQATVFNRSSFDKILSINPSNVVTVDGVIAERQKSGELKAFACIPVLITQKANYSYNELREVNRAENHIL